MSWNGQPVMDLDSHIVEPIETGRPLGRRDTFGLTRRSNMEGGRKQKMLSENALRLCPRLRA